MDEGLTYRNAGVDIDAGAEAIARMREAIARTHSSSVLASTGSFAGLYRIDFPGCSEPCLVSSMDSVGTKISIAAAAGRLDGAGRDLVNHCVNDILVLGAKPLFFLDYFATSRLDPDEAAQIVNGAADACAENGCALIGGETAELPGIYKEGECDFAGCIVGIVDREKVLGPNGVKPGDAVLGLASTGLHTNGYSLARKALLEQSGYSLDSFLPDLGQTVADALLAPHRSYLKSVQAALESGMSIRAIAHITGGGLYDNIPRVLPEAHKAVLDRRSWTVSPIFHLIQKSGDISDVEMHHTFNMGVGMVLIVSRGQAPAACEFFSEQGEIAWQIGEIVRGNREVQLI